MATERSRRRTAALRLVEAGEIIDEPLVEVPDVGSSVWRHSAGPLPPMAILDTDPMPHLDVPDDTGELRFAQAMIAMNEAYLAYNDVLTHLPVNGDRVARAENQLSGRLTKLQEAWLMKQTQQ